MDRKVAVSVIIPVYNRARALEKCLASVLNQDFKNRDIFLIDDASTDKTPQTVKDYFLEVNLIRHATRLGPSASRNEGARLSQGKYLWFLDSDVIIENKSCLSNMVDILNQGNSIGALGGEYRYLQDGSAEFRKKVIFSNGETFTLAASENEYYSQPCGFVATCNCIIKKSVFEKIGGFDPEYFITSEDCELGYKISKYGLQNIVDARTSVFHNMKVDDRKSDLLWLLKNRIRFVFKNFSLLKIIFLPVIELESILNFAHFKKLTTSDPNILKHIPPWSRSLFKNGRFKHAIGVMFVGIFYAGCLFAAYIWNLLLLPATLLSRLKKTYLT